jgi:hypothetical protein
MRVLGEINSLTDEHDAFVSDQPPVRVPMRG